MREMVAALSHIDAGIRVFDANADIDDIKPKLPPRFQAFKGELSRLVLNALRKGTEAIAGIGLDADRRGRSPHQSRRQAVYARSLAPRWRMSAEFAKKNWLL